MRIEKHNILDVQCIGNASDFDIYLTIRNHDEPIKITLPMEMVAELIGDLLDIIEQQIINLQKMMEV